MIETNKGPCLNGGIHFPIENNEHGNLRIHPCLLCKQLFIWSMAKNTWVELTDEMLVDSINAKLKLIKKDDWQTLENYTEKE